MNLFFSDNNSIIKILACIGAIAIVIIPVLLICLVHGNTMRRKREQSLMAEQRIQIMMSQIQPHFLYNTLSTIQALCRKDPELAAQTVEKLGDYLRQNLAALGQSDLIPFNKELEHTRIYVDIEKLMSPDMEIEYQINDYNFLLPALTIQPLVENAIRHGIRGVKGGRITISARRDEGYHTIEITDNGKGFDVNDTLDTAGGKHIGIRNVSERVEKMCDGTLDVESTPGTGTTVTIFIPFREETA
jgi:sensor histidine kinase YesM